MDHKRTLVKLLDAILRVKLASPDYVMNPAFTNDVDSLAENDEIKSISSRNKSLSGFFKHLLKHHSYDALFDVLIYFWENQNPAVQNVFGYTTDELHQIWEGHRNI